MTMVMMIKIIQDQAHKLELEVKKHLTLKLHKNKNYKALKMQLT